MSRTQLNLKGVRSPHDFVQSELNPVKDLRPFYFIVVYWGDQFRNYLINYCLPSLMSPNNIPAIAAMEGNKFLFCTTSEDWNAITQTSIFLNLQRYIEPYFIEIPAAPDGKSGCEHMGVGHKLAAQMAFQDKACGVFLTPDLMVSDGTVLTLQQCARAGYKVVLTAALRFGEEPLFENLHALGIVSKAPQHSDAGLPLVISGRQMVRAGIKSFHSQTMRYEWASPYFSSFPCACWWRVPGDEEGIVLHSLSWAPFLCDYSAVAVHDTSVFDEWTLDGDYVYENFKDTEDIYIVRDSDEMMLISWAPLADRPQSTVPNPIKRLSVIGNWLKGGILRAVLLSGVFDVLKQRIFFLPVRWHTKDVTSVWDETELNAQNVLRQYLWGIPYDHSTCSETHELTPGNVGNKPMSSLARFCFTPMVTVGRLWMIMSDLYMFRSRLTWKLGLALRGDSKVWGRIIRRFGIIWKTIRGVPIRNL